MSTPYAPATDIGGVLSDLQEGVDQAGAGVDAIITGIDAVLDLLPDIVVGGVREAVAELQRVFAEKVVELGALLAHAGEPDALRAAGSAWANEIGATTSRLAGFTTLNGVGADDHWTGIAATAYRNTLLPQSAALTAVKTTGDEIDATLNELANAIFTFWVSVATAAIALVVALWAAAATAATVVGAPVGAGVGIAAVVAFGGAMTATIASLNDIVTETAARSAELERRVSNDTAFPGGAWPRSTTPITGDGSITDGDDTDWHLE